MGSVYVQSCAMQTHRVETAVNLVSAKEKTPAMGFFFTNSGIKIDMTNFIISFNQLLSLNQSSNLKTEQGIMGDGALMKICNVTQVDSSKLNVISGDVLCHLPTFCHLHCCP